VLAAHTFRKPRRFETERVNRAHTHMPANLTSSLPQVRHGIRLAGFMIGAPSRRLACEALHGPRILQDWTDFEARQKCAW
jgi:hypothetical protein